MQLLRTLIIAFLFSASAYGLEIGEDFSRVDLRDACEAWVSEPVDNISAEQLNVFVADAVWQPCKNFDLARGYSDESVWLKFELKNAHSRGINVMYDIYVSWLGHIKWFELDGQKVIQEKVFGIHYPYYQREIPTPNTVFSQYLPPQAQRTSIVQIQGDQSLLIGGYLHAETESYRQQVIVTLINGGVLFSIALLIAYNLVLFFSLRDVNYLYYVGYSAAMLFLLGVIYGFNYQLFWPNSPSWNLFTHAAASQLTAIFIVLFVRNFLNTKVVTPKLDVGLVFILYISLFLLLFCIPESTRNFALSWAGPLAALGGPIVLAVGVSAWVQGYRAARFFTIAWAASLLAITVLGLMVTGYVQFNFGLYYSFAFAVLLEIAMLSLALADKYHSFRHDKTVADNAALAAERELADTLKQAASELEQEVIVRTADLRKAKQVAETLARTDELTGMANRRDYFERGAIAFDNARKTGKKYGIVMLDIDKFKTVNDTYGHAIGDRVIIEIAKLLGALLPNDAIAGRIGGEEFGIILPAYTLDTVTDVAEAMREAVEEAQLQFASDQNLQVTISAGVAEFNSGDRDIDEAMARADIGLYQAKETGRNKVVIYQP